MKNAKKEDLRVIKTKKLIRKSFVELSKKINYQKISVKDLCDNAMINRNTFYLHYQPMLTIYEGCLLLFLLSCPFEIQFH